MLDFAVTPVNSSALLGWQTTNEINVSGFNVMRSTDGVNYEKIAFVKATNSIDLTKKNSYSYIDNNLKTGIGYFYKIEQVDIDGFSKYSAIRSLKLSAVSKVLVYPNPVESNLNVVLGITGQVDIKLLDLSGRVLLNLNKVSVSGSYQISMSGYTAGEYILDVKLNDGTSIQSKVVKL